ncbi:MAG: ABC transporter ATP-binding protein [Deltaproteobacteria bacterium]|nr:ABC transporter ATP-binding protein [Deltaproteobacteria bacterium]
MEKIVQIQDVTKVYEEGKNRVVAVDSVSLEVKKGEVLLVMGPSGSGKTTLLSMIGCILHPTSGDVKVDGTSVAAMKERELPDIRKRYFGFVFQSFNLFPSLTAAENVEVVLRLKGWDRARLKKDSVGLLGRVGLERRAGFYPRDLSGGEKQRVAFARAMAGDPPIILADEPTANLDSKTGKEVLGLLKEFSQTAGKAVVIISHDPKAEAMAHRTVFLEDGRLKQ